MPYLAEVFSSRIEAELAAQILAEEGIPSRVASSDAGGAIPSMQALAGVRLEVANEDADRAEELISETFPAGASVLEPLSRRERIQSWAAGIGLLLFVIVLVVYGAQNGAPSGTPVPPGNHQLPY